MVEGEIMDCPACNGEGVVLTEDGKQLMEFLEIFARPALRSIVREVMEQERS
jgi:predicted methyltransferase